MVSSGCGMLLPNKSFNTFNINPVISASLLVSNVFAYLPATPPPIKYFVVRKESN
jgi:hypothetical protein